MALNLIKKTLKILEKYNLKYTINTNGTLITKDVVEVFKAYDFNVTISLDGFKMIHDTNRKVLGYKGSYDLVIKSINLLKENNIKFIIEATFHPNNLLNGTTPYKVALYLSKFSKIFTIGLASNFSTNIERIQEDLHEIAIIYLGDYLVRSLYELVKDNPLYIEDAIYRFVSMITNGVFTPFRCHFFRMLSVTPNGDIYPCNLLITELKGRIGNIMSNSLKEITDNYQKLVRKMLSEVLIEDYPEYLFEFCPLEEALRSKPRVKHILRIIYDNLLLTLYEIIKTDKLFLIKENLEKFKK